MLFSFFLFLASLELKGAPVFLLLLFTSNLCCLHLAGFPHRSFLFCLFVFQYGEGGGTHLIRGLNQNAKCTSNTFMPGNSSVIFTKLLVLPVIAVCFVFSCATLNHDQMM